MPTVRPRLAQSEGVAGLLPRLPLRRLGRAQRVQAPSEGREGMILQSGTSCPGALGIAIPLGVIAFMLCLVALAEFLRRERTKTRDDDWIQFHDDTKN